MGLVAPGIPGPALIWAGSALWAWGDGFEAVGLPTLALLAVLGIAAMSADLALGAAGARRGGVPAASLVVAGLCGIVGLVVFSVIGAVAGTLLGLVAMETRRHGDWRTAVRSGRLLIAGYVAGIVVQIVVGVAMVAVFAAQALQIV